MRQGSDWRSPLTRCTYAVRTEDVELVIALVFVVTCSSCFLVLSQLKKKKKTDWLWKPDWKCCELELGKIVF